MGKFFSVPGMAPSGGEGSMGGGRQWPSEEQLHRRHSSYYKNKPEYMTSAFAEAGDRMKIHGDEAEVKHVEKNSDGTQDVYLQRSSANDSGSYIAKVESAPNRQQRIRKLKRTYE